MDGVEATPAQGRRVVDPALPDHHPDVAGDERWGRGAEPLRRDSANPRLESMYKRDTYARPVKQSSFPSRIERERPDRRRAGAPWRLKGWSSSRGGPLPVAPS